MHVYAHKCKPPDKTRISHYSATFAVTMKSFFENSSATTGAFFKNSSTSTKDFFTRSTNSTKEFFRKKSVFVKPSVMDVHAPDDPDDGALDATSNSSYAGSAREPADLLLYGEAVGGSSDLDARGNRYKTVRAKAKSVSRGNVFYDEFWPVENSSQLEGDKTSTDTNSVPRQRIFTSANDEQDEDDSISDESVVVSIDESFSRRQSVLASSYGARQPVFTSADKEDNEDDQKKRVHCQTVFTSAGCSQKESSGQYQGIFTSPVYGQDLEASSSASSSDDECDVAFIHEDYPQRPLVCASVLYEDEGSLGQDESEAASIDQRFGHERFYTSAEYSQDGYEADVSDDETDEASSEDDLEEDEGGFFSAGFNQNDDVLPSVIGSSINSESDHHSMDESFGQGQSEFYLSRGNLRARQDEDVSVDESFGQRQSEFYLSRGNLRARQDEDFFAHRSPEHDRNNLFASQNSCATASDESDAAFGYRTFSQGCNSIPRHNEFDSAGGTQRHGENQFFSARPKSNESGSRNRNSQYESDESFIEETREGQSEFYPRSSNRKSEFFPANNSRNRESEFHPRASNETGQPPLNAKNRFMPSQNSSFHPHGIVPPSDTTTWFERTKVAIKYHLQKVTNVLWKQDKVDDVLHFLTHVSIFLYDCARGCPMKRLSDIAPDAYCCPINLFRSGRFYFY